MTVNNQYEKLLLDVINNGTYKDDRTGTGTRSVFGRQLRYDLSGGQLPLITTKHVSFRLVALELLWFLSGDTNINWLQERNVHIWDEWADENGELGPVYGHQWRSWGTADGGTVDQIAALVDGLKNNPDSRRHIVSAWNAGQIDEMALPPCHAFFQFYVADGKLSCQIYQRSADMFLGVPFNIASYALLTHMLASVVGLEAGELVWTGGDVHVYSNHMEQVGAQVTRTPFSFPTININPEVKSIDDFSITDFEVVNYRHHPPIRAVVAV